MMNIDGLQLHLANIVERDFVRDYPHGKEICFTRSDTARYDGNVVYGFFYEKEWKIFLEDDFNLIKQFFSKVRSFSYFTSVGFAYYIPAFLIYVSKYQDQEFMEMLFYRLQPDNSRASIDSFNDFFSLLSEVEVIAIQKALSVLNDIWASWGEEKNWARDALEGYWQNL